MSIFWIALLVYVLFIFGYWFFVWSVYWHIREYTMPQDQSRLVVQIFMTVIVVLSVISTGLFFTLPIYS
jgi:hypothetical protein